MALVELHNVSFTYPATSTPALRNVTLSIGDGEFVAVVGANGAGKSTLCYTVAGFIPHFYRGVLEGEATVDGLDIRATPLDELVLHAGLVFQNPFNQISGAKFTVREEVAFGLENMGVAPGEMRARVDAVLEMLGIAGLAERSPYALSGGQQQRVALASIWVMEPRVLILDEPTSQLDPLGSREVFAAIRALTRRGQAVLMAEHKLEWIAAFADRVMVLSEGEIVLEGSPDDVLTSPKLDELKIGQTRYTLAARRAQQTRLWPEGRSLPVTLARAAEGFASTLARQSHADRRQ